MVPRTQRELLAVDSAGSPSPGGTLRGLRRPAQRLRGPRAAGVRGAAPRPGHRGAPGGLRHGPAPPKLPHGHASRSLQGGRVPRRRLLGLSAVSLRFPERFQRGPASLPGAARSHFKWRELPAGPPRPAGPTREPERGVRPHGPRRGQQEARPSAGERAGQRAELVPVLRKQVLPAAAEAAGAPGEAAEEAGPARAGLAAPSERQRQRAGGRPAGRPASGGRGPQLGLAQQPVGRGPRAGRGPGAHDGCQSQCGGENNRSPGTPRPAVKLAQRRTPGPGRAASLPTKGPPLRGAASDTGCGRWSPRHPQRPRRF